MRCGLCGAAMVGQTLTVKEKPYSYYRCRHAFDRRNGKHCETRYVRAVDLEQAIWREVTAVLARPMVVLEELERARRADQPPDRTEERAALEREIVGVQERERRLVRLYTFGEIDDKTVRAEGTELRRRRQVLEERLAALRPVEAPADRPIDPAMLERACGLVSRWLDEAGAEQRMRALEALQVAVTATREAATVTGMLPIEAPAFITEEQSSRCTFPGK